MLRRSLHFVRHALLRTCLLAGLASTVFTGCRLTDRPGREASLAGRPPIAGQVDNQPPRIEGIPPSMARVGEPYEFVPAATDPDGDRLVFEIAGQPHWARFDTSSGRLYGSPLAGSRGTFTDIRITVSDGTAQASLPAFSITVGDAAVGSATLRWVAPTQTSGGEPLTDLAGFRIYYGQSSANLDRVVTIDDRSATQAVIEGLVPGTWFFAITACTSAGVESSRSNVVSKGI
jgi:Putative Ig domain